jgi:hypothetical protein
MRIICKSLSVTLLCIVFSTSARAQVSYTVPDPSFEIAQPTNNTCWTTAATMLLSWKAKSPLAIKDVASQAGATYLALFTTTDTGLNSSNKATFLSALNLTAEPPQSYSAQALESKLRLWGPLWITTAEGDESNFSIHARVLLGISGDGTGSGTTLVIVDPADGARHIESLDDFTKKLETVARSDYGSGADVRPLIVHL